MMSANKIKNNHHTRHEQKARDKERSEREKKEKQLQEKQKKIQEANELFERYVQSTAERNGVHKTVVMKEMRLLLHCKHFEDEPDRFKMKSAPANILLQRIAGPFIQRRIQLIAQYNK